MEKKTTDSSQKAFFVLSIILPCLSRCPKIAFINKGNKYLIQIFNCNISTFLQSAQKSFKEHDAYGYPFQYEYCRYSIRQYTFYHRITIHFHAQMKIPIFFFKIKKHFYQFDYWYFLFNFTPANEM